MRRFLKAESQTIQVLLIFVSRLHLKDHILLTVEFALNHLPLLYSAVALHLVKKATLYLCFGHLWQNNQFF